MEGIILNDKQVETIVDYLEREGKVETLTSN